MKRNRVVLILLVTWSLLSISSLSFVAYAGSADVSQRDDSYVLTAGASDDDNGGDPGDAGDGYGIADGSDPSGLNGLDGIDNSFRGEFLLILASLVQLVL